MPLHPRAEKFLLQMKALGSPSPHKMSPDMARKAQATGYAFMAASLTPVPVEKVENRTVSTPKRETPVRIYWPNVDEDNGPLPMLVFIHGGGFVLGDLDQYDDMCRRLCSGAQSIVVSVDYGLAPEWKFPDPVNECYAVTQWAFEHAESLGGDSQRVAIAGDSAGGNLSAVIALMARDAKQKGEKAPHLVYQVLMYPAVDQHNETTGSKVRNASGYFLEAEDMLWFRECYLNQLEDAKNPLASPLLAADHHNLPPALVITAEFDPLHDEGAAYAEKLREAGVPVHHADYPGMIHGFMSMTFIFDDGVDALNLVTQKLQDAFSNNSPKNM